jgi:hypothetical protein
VIEKLPHGGGEVTSVEAMTGIRCVERPSFGTCCKRTAMDQARHDACCELLDRSNSKKLRREEPALDGSRLPSFGRHRSGVTVRDSPLGIHRWGVTVGASLPDGAYNCRTKALGWSMQSVRVANRWKASSIEHRGSRIGSKSRRMIFGSLLADTPSYHARGGFLFR